MKKIFFAFIFLLNLVCIFAQNQVNMIFTAKMTDNAWIALDSVRITNLTRGWTETVYYPDTTLQMTNSVGIQEIEKNEFQLYQNSPNPFNGTTSVSLAIPKQEKVEMTLFDINGRQCAVYSNILEKGEHTFTISVAALQMYVLQVRTSECSRSIRMLAVKPSNKVDIVYQSYKSATEKDIQKAITNQSFVSNDSMEFIGYATCDGEIKMKKSKVIQLGSNSIYTFNITIGYSIGDVYYDNFGIAQGIVCWIADTIFTLNNIPYGKHGKILSLDEGSGKMYSTNIPSRPTGATDSLDGRINTAIQMALKSDTSTYPYPERLEAVTWCTNKGSDWYFPAKCELFSLYPIVNKLNLALNNMGAISICVDTMEGALYWSSTEKKKVDNNINTAYGIYMDDGYNASYPIYQKARVRAIKRF